MKTLSMMEIRKHLGTIVDEVRLKSETVIVERAGRPVAMICPLEGARGNAEGQARRLRAIRELTGLYAGSARGRDVDAWVTTERSNWE